VVPTVRFAPVVPWAKAGPGHKLVELTNNIRHEIVTITGQEVHCSAGVLAAFGQKGNISSNCCSIGDLLDFLMVGITVSLFLTYFTNC
jgi:hypothetical protein